jgi:hypothetical protein
LPDFTDEDDLDTAMEMLLLDVRNLEEGDNDNGDEESDKEAEDIAPAVATAVKRPAQDPQQMPRKRAKLEAAYPADKILTGENMPPFLLPSVEDVTHGLPQRYHRDWPQAYSSLAKTKWRNAAHEYLSCLAPSQWLSTEVLSTFARLMMRQRLIEGDVFIFPTEWMQADLLLLMKRYKRKFGKDVERAQFIVLIVCQNAHFWLTIFDKENSRFTVVDSLSKKKHSIAYQNIVAKLDYILVNAFGEYPLSGG